MKTIMTSLVLRQSIRWLVGLGALALVMSAEATILQFDSRQNVNLLNSWAVSIDASPFLASDTSPGNGLRGNNSASSAPWQNKSTATADSREIWTINLGAVRNVQTVLGFSTSSANMFTNALVQTSTDNVTWSGFLPATVSWNGAGTTIATLTTPVDTQFLKVTGTNFNNAGNLLRLEALRVYGAAGRELPVDGKLDLLSSSAFSTPNAVQISISPTSSGHVDTANTLTDIINDRPASMANVGLKIITNGMAVTFTFTNLNQTITFNKFGFEMTRDSFAGNGVQDNNMHFQIWGSTNGIDFTSLLLDQTGGYGNMGDTSSGSGGATAFFNLPEFIGEGLQFRVVSTTAPNLRFSDFFVFEVAIPEPSTFALFGLGVGLIVRFRHRCGPLNRTS